MGWNALDFDRLYWFEDLFLTGRKIGANAVNKYQTKSGRENYVEYQHRVLVQIQPHCDAKNKVEAQESFPPRIGTQLRRKVKTVILIAARTMHFWRPDKFAFFSAVSLYDCPGVVKGQPHGDGHKNGEHQHKFSDFLWAGARGTMAIAGNIGLKKDEYEGNNSNGKDQIVFHVDVEP